MVVFTGQQVRTRRTCSTPSRRAPSSIGPPASLGGDRRLDRGAAPGRGRRAAQRLRPAPCRRAPRRSSGHRVRCPSRGGLLRCIVCTPTLLEGVDFPTRTVIAAYPPRTAEQRPDIARLRNLEGRAGRAGRFVSGRLVVMTSDHEQARKWRRAMRQDASADRDRAHGGAEGAADARPEYMSPETRTSSTPSPSRRSPSRPRSTGTSAGHSRRLCSGPSGRRRPLRRCRPRADDGDRLRGAGSPSRCPTPRCARPSTARG